MPAGPDKSKIKLLDDLTVASNRALESLQITINDKCQIVEIFSGCQGQSCEGFGFIHFAITKNSPQLPLLGLSQLSVFEVAHEVRLKDRGDRAYPHRASWHLPEIFQKPRVRVGA